MNTTNSTTTEDPAAIEQDIRRTQEDMSRTVDKLGNQLTLRNILDSVLDQADQNNVDARTVLDGARRNPIALGLIAAGTIWLISDKDSKFPSVGSKKSGSSDELDLDGQDIHHRDYVSHMSSVEWREGEDEIAYQRRRDIARSNFLMCERRPDEDDHSFRQRLDEMTDKFREKRRAWMDSASHARTATTDGARNAARSAASRTQDMYSSNPLAGGLIAAAVGAVLGSAVPISRQEQEKLGSLGSKARDMASEQKHELISQAREKKDEMLDKADRKLQETGSEPQGGSQGSSFGGSSSQGGSSQGSSFGSTTSASGSPQGGSSAESSEPTRSPQPTFGGPNS